jgi:hypothetical protein
LNNYKNVAHICKAHLGIKIHTRHTYTAFIVGRVMYDIVEYIFS